MDKKTIILSATANRGIGFWTSICVAFGNFFGLGSFNYDRKVQDLIDDIKEDLLEQMARYKDYEFSDIKIASDRSLSFVATVMGIKK